MLPNLDLDENMWEMSRHDPLRLKGTSEIEIDSGHPSLLSNIIKVKNNPTHTDTDVDILSKYQGNMKSRGDNILFLRLLKIIEMKNADNFWDIETKKDKLPASEKALQKQKITDTSNLNMSLRYVVEDKDESDVVEKNYNIVSVRFEFCLFSGVMIHPDHLPSTVISCTVGIKCCSTLVSRKTGGRRIKKKSWSGMLCKDVEILNSDDMIRCLQPSPASDLQDTGETSGGGGDSHSGGSDFNQRQTFVGTSPSKKAQSSGSGSCGGGGGGGDDGGEERDNDPTKRRPPLDKDQTVQEQPKTEKRIKERSGLFARTMVEEITDRGSLHGSRPPEANTNQAASVSHCQSQVTEIRAQVSTICYLFLSIASFFLLWISLTDLDLNDGIGISFLNNTLIIFQLACMDSNDQTLDSLSQMDSARLDSVREYTLSSLSDTTALSEMDRCLAHIIAQSGETGTIPPAPPSFRGVGRQTDSCDVCCWLILTITHFLSCLTLPSIDECAQCELMVRVLVAHMMVCLSPQCALCQILVLYNIPSPVDNVRMSLRSISAFVPNLRQRLSDVFPALLTRRQHEELEARSLQMLSTQRSSLGYQLGFQPTTQSWLPPPVTRPFLHTPPSLQTLPSLPRFMGNDALPGNFEDSEEDIVDHAEDNVYSVQQLLEEEDLALGGDVRRKRPAQEPRQASITGSTLHSMPTAYSNAPPVVAPPGDGLLGDDVQAVESPSVVPRHGFSRSHSRRDTSSLNSLHSTTTATTQPKVVTGCVEYGSLNDLEATIASWSESESQPDITEGVILEQDRQVNLILIKSHAKCPYFLDSSSMLFCICCFSI